MKSIGEYFACDFFMASVFFKLKYDQAENSFCLETFETIPGRQLGGIDDDLIKFHKLNSSKPYRNLNSPPLYFSNNKEFANSSNFTMVLTIWDKNLR